jgi:hypothetical protein
VTPQRRAPTPIRLARIAEDNPDLPLSMIAGILEAQAEERAGADEPYPWGVLEEDDCSS